MSLGTPLIAALVTLLVLGFWMLGAHNRVTALRGAVLSGWALVEAAMQARGKAIGALIDAAIDPLASERAALDAVVAAQVQVAERAEALRRRPTHREGVAELSKADAVLTATLPRLLALIEQHPELHARTEVATALAELGDLRPRLAFARSGFNQAGAAYNAAVAQFPTRLLGNLFRFGEAGHL
jgi:LemA protein